MNACGEAVSRAKNGQWVIIAIVAAAGGALVATWATPLAGQTPAAYRAPRTSDGKPDLNGIWQAMNEANYDLEAHMARPAMALRPGPYGPVPAAPVLALGAVGSVPPGMGVVEGDDDSVQARSARQEKREPGEVARARSRDQVLPARRAARDLHAVAVPDPPEPERDFLRVPVRRRGAEHLLEGSRPGADRFVDGTVGRALGRRHAGHRRHRLQRQHLVRSRRQLPQRQAARRRALHAHRARRHQLRGDDRGSETSSRGRGRSACRSTAGSRRTRS